jgi:hypothetical protein
VKSAVLLQRLATETDVCLHRPKDMYLVRRLTECTHEKPRWHVCLRGVFEPSKRQIDPMSLSLLQFSWLAMPLQHRK